MNTVPYDFAVIGGDLRQVYMAEILSTKGYKVVVCGLAAETYNQTGMIKKTQTLQEAISNAKITVGAVPLTKDKATIEIIKASLTDEKQFFAGCISDELREFLKSKHIFMYDFMDNEELVVINTIATAEGTIAEAIVKQTTNLHGADCLILGFGKCATVLAHKLKGLSANITVCARNDLSRAIATSYGYEAISFQDLEKKINQFEYIFNTVPKQIIDKNLLTHIGKQSIIIDIASAPGGVDFEAAGEMGINAHLCLGLPGKYAPRKSAEALAAVLLKNLKGEVS